MRLKSINASSVGAKMNKDEINGAKHYLESLLITCENTNDIQIIYDEICLLLRDLEKRSKQMEKR